PRREESVSEPGAERWDLTIPRNLMIRSLPLSVLTRTLNAWASGKNHRDPNRRSEINLVRCRFAFSINPPGSVFDPLTQCAGRKTSCRSRGIDTDRVKKLRWRARVFLVCWNDERSCRRIAGIAWNACFSGDDVSHSTAR